jgi:hypothetical protein
LGGSGDDYTIRIDVDDAGNACVTGATQSADFPTTNAFDPTHNGGLRDAVICKYSPDGIPSWSTFLGGAGDDIGYGIAVDGAGNVFAGGFTQSADFPTTNGDAKVPGGGFDMFVARISTEGVPVWSTCLGGGAEDNLNWLEVDNDGNVCLTGSTRSGDFPTSDAYDSSYNAGLDVVVAKLGGDGRLIWSTYLGGGQDDLGGCMTVDGQGNVYIAGRTDSSDFPTSGGFDTALDGSRDAFVAKFTADGALVWSTFLGGSQNDNANGIGVDPAGNVYVAGYTLSSDFPTTKAHDATYNGGNEDAFVTKLGPDGSLIWSSFLGGSGDEHASLGVDRAGNVYVNVYTNSADFPVLSASDPMHNGGFDVSLTRFASDGDLVWSTFLGGSQDDQDNVIAPWRGRVYVTGITRSNDFPTPNGYDTDHNGGPDAFVAKFVDSYVGFAALTSSAGEDTGIANILVYLSRPCSTTVTVDYTVTSGTATGGGVDYDLTSGTLTFKTGQTSRTIDIIIVDDQLDERDEAIVVRLSDPCQPILVVGSHHRFTILDDDASPTFTSATIVPRHPFTTSTLSVDVSGWSDGDGDPEFYFYQWKRNGVDIVGATSSTLTSEHFQAHDYISCVVTAWDGINIGTRIEAGPVYIRLVPSEVGRWRKY